ncbi:hydrolase acyltransferase (alpha beta hydrolase superfamily) [Olea europaea subsp. europaea]|uniref:Hydrolase acyltransferase (Alpha beta hydrolase superfamily) n=1 Tax=Olea europaea subsp. europaea TaxID=158383 RepID=A0A8S0SJ83_OLEEU|nr:hydrolase acyltransferase (alpha beta hydrolase superfamily) [Olea europaea subsp. europaea]
MECYHPPILELFVPPVMESSSSHLTTTRFLASKRFRTTVSIVAKASEEADDKPAFNPFGFVTYYPSIRSANQLPKSPAEDENVGQMLYVIT